LTSGMLTLYYNQIFESGSVNGAYAPTGAEFSTQFANLMSVVTRIDNPANITVFAVISQATYQTSETYIANFPCSFFGKKNLQSGDFEDTCDTCTDQNEVVFSTRYCKTTDTKCLYVDINGECIQCLNHYILSGKNCLSVVSDPSLLASLVDTNGSPIAYIPPNPPPTPTLDPSNSTTTTVTTQLPTTTSFQSQLVPTMDNAVGFIPASSAILQASRSSTDCSWIDPRCLECLGSQCLVCAPGYTLLVNGCEVQICSDLNCFNCPVAQICQVCAIGYELTSDGSCTTTPELLSVQSLLTASNNPLDSVILCPQNCLQCPASGKCWKCNLGYSYVASQNICIQVSPVALTNSNSQTKDSISGDVDCRVWGNCTTSEFGGGATDNCAACPTCQIQSTFYCQGCIACRSTCRCVTKSATIFVGVIVNCPKVLFLESFVSKFSQTSPDFAIEVPKNDLSSLHIRPRKPATNNLALLITPSFVQASSTCTFSSPITIYYSPPPQLFLLGEFDQRATVHTIYLVRTGLLFTFNILGNSLGQVLLSVIELNTFFSFIGLLGLPIPGFYAAILTLSTDEEANPAEMSLFLPASFLPTYQFLNEKYHGHYILNQTVLLVNTVTIACFLFIGVLRKLLSLFSTPTFAGAKPLVRAASLAYRFAEATFEALCGANFMGLCPGIHFVVLVFSKVASIRDALGLFVCVAAAFLTSLNLKLRELAEFIRVSPHKTSFPNDMGVASSKIYWLRLHSFLEEIFSWFHLILVFSFQHHRRLVLYLTAAFCVLQAGFAVGMSLKHLPLIAALKTAQFLSMFGFIRLCLGMIDGQYTPHAWGFNLLFTLSHGFKMASLACEFLALFRNAAVYKETGNRMRRQISEEKNRRFARKLIAFQSIQNSEISNVRRKYRRSFSQ